MPDVKDGWMYCRCCSRVSCNIKYQHVQQIASQSVATIQHVQYKEAVATILPLPCRQANETTLSACKPWMPCMTAVDACCDAFQAKLLLAQHVQH